MRVSFQKSFEVEKPMDCNIARSPGTKKRERNESEGAVAQLEDSALDTSAIDAMCLSGNNEGAESSGSDSITEMLSPPVIVVSVFHACVTRNE